MYPLSRSLSLRGQGMEILVYMTDEVLVALWEDKTNSEWLTTQTTNYRETSAPNRTHCTEADVKKQQPGTWPSLGKTPQLAVGIRWPAVRVCAIREKQSASQGEEPEIDELQSDVPCRCCPIPLLSLRHRFPLTVGKGQHRGMCVWGGIPDSERPLSRSTSPFSELTFPEPLLACSPLVKSVFSGVVGLLCAWFCFRRLNFGDPAAAWITGDWGFDRTGFSNSLASCN